MERNVRTTPNSSAQIFDRYGKLIIELNAANYSWDGKINSKIYLQMIIGYLNDNTTQK
jgi:gliding motility-associated-like protein